MHFFERLAYPLSHTMTILVLLLYLCICVFFVLLFYLYVFCIGIYLYASVCMSIYISVYVYHNMFVCVPTQPSEIPFSSFAAHVNKAIRERQQPSTALGW